MLFMLHPKRLMNFIVGVETQKFSIADTDSLWFVDIDIWSDELWPILLFYQFLVLILNLDHIAFQIFNNNLQKLNSFMSESKLKVTIDFGDKE